jgi:hypothetical protein
MIPIVDDLCNCVSNRIARVLSESSDSPKAALVRADIERLVPYILLGMKQMELEPSAVFCDASLELFSRYVSEIPFSHVSQFVLSFPKKRLSEDPRWQALAMYCVESVMKSPTDFQVIDLCRLAAGLDDYNIVNQLFAEAPKRSHLEWSIHALKESSVFLDRDEIPKQFRKSFLREMKRNSSQLPPSYLIEIIRNATRRSPGIAASGLALLTRKLRRMTEPEILMTLQLDLKFLPHAVVNDFVTAASLREKSGNISSNSKIDSS